MPFVFQYLLENKEKFESLKLVKIINRSHILYSKITWQESYWKASYYNIFNVTLISIKHMK